jgi:hypothetical protein
MDWSVFQEIAASIGAGMPQGLKPLVILALIGTTKVVP